MRYPCWAIRAAGEVRLKIPKLRQQTFETAIIERYRRRESSAEKALIEMYLAGVLGAPRGRHHRGFVGHSNVAFHSVRREQEDLRNDRGVAQPADQTRAPYVYLDGLVLKRNWAGEIRNASLLVAIGLNEEDYREILASAKGRMRTKRVGAASSNISRNAACTASG